MNTCDGWTCPTHATEEPTSKVQFRYDMRHNIDVLDLCPKCLEDFRKTSELQENEHYIVTRK